MASVNDEIRTALSQALVNGDADTAAEITRKALEAGALPLDLIQLVIVPTLTKVGQDFQEFVKNVAMQIAAANPLGVTKEDVPQDVVERERAIYLAQAQESGKPANILEKMVDGKLRKFFQEVVLLEQTYVKDPDKTIQDYLNELLAKTGEKIIIKRFVRFQLGGE